MSAFHYQLTAASLAQCQAAHSSDWQLAVMMLWSSAVLVLLGLSGPLWAQRPPTVSVNLDLSPEQRWEHLQEAFDTDLMKKAAQILIR